MTQGGNMLKSMTGYGKGEAAAAGVSVVVEIRTVNHRFSDISIKAPRYLLSLENNIRKMVSAELNRGKIDLFFQIDLGDEVGSTPSINTTAASAYMKIFEEMRETYGLSSEVPLELLAGQKDVIEIREMSVDDSDIPELAMDALGQALTALQAMRAKEGEAMLKEVYPWPP